MTASHGRDLDDLLDRLVAEYSDKLSRGEQVERAEFLRLVPDEHRDALPRCLAMLDTGRASARPERRVLGAGSELAGYRITGVLGRGGMSVVYRAEQPELQRSVALKVLRPGLALDRRHVDRFRREALAVARLNHPNIVQIHAVGEQDGFHYIAMECVEGPNLADVLGALPTDRPWTAHDLAEATGCASLAAFETYERAFAAFMAPVARAVGVAHDLGIVHRDLKPSNILVHKDGRALVADFGLAKGDGDLELSLTGEPLGTPYYMSPEQVQQSEAVVDARTDVYSLGVTLFEGLTGRRPFTGRSLAAIFDAIRHGAPPLLRHYASQRGRDAEAVVARAMQRDPARRYRSALELSSDLVALADGQRTQARAEQRPPFATALSVLAGTFFSPDFEYRSRATFLGWPLVHIDRGSGRNPRTGKLRVAKGWFASGQIAVGAVAIGSISFGGVCLGGIGCGLLSVAGMAFGALAIGGMAVGVIAQGGVAAGFAAVGGVAVGHFAAGGWALGAHAMHGLGSDAAAVGFFDRWMPWISAYFEQVGGR